VTDTAERAASVPTSGRTLVGYRDGNGIQLFLEARFSQGAIGILHELFAERRVTGQSV
jgi:hypothetical protein